MSENFQQSDCQNFTQSPCQNRDRGTTQAPLFGLSTNSAFGGSQPPYVNGLQASDVGTIDSVDLPGQTWNISWQFRPPQGGGYGVSNTKVQGIICVGWIALIGPASKLVGTVGLHSIISITNPPGSNGRQTTFAPASVTHQIAGAPSGIAFFQSVPIYQVGALIWIWWPGRTPAQLPAANFSQLYMPIPTQAGGDLGAFGGLYGANNG